MPKAKRNSVSTTPQRIPRPRNAFIIFRNDLVLTRANEGKQTQSTISKEASKLWKAASPAVKQEYILRAKQEKEEHAEKYPGYVYKPRTREQIEKDKEDKAEQARSKRRVKGAGAPYYLTFVLDDGVEDSSTDDSSSSLRSFSPPSSVSDSASQTSPFNSGDSSQDFGSREVSPYSNVSPGFLVGESAWASNHSSFEGQLHDSSLGLSSTFDTSFSQQSSEEANAAMYNALAYGDFFRAIDAMVTNQNIDPTTTGLNAPDYNESTAAWDAFALNASNFGEASTDFSNAETGFDVSSFNDHQQFGSSSSTELLPELDPSLLLGNYLGRDELYQRYQPIDYQLELYRLPSYDD
ncbi:hypothetical protein F5050DRAFT_63571 [Lentinula boryana]|uniref:HMG box domain-containing protein n=1 Tax=Lentinula boryana TaxID=40481 RepID=A0ABQ8QDS3_9AGAR|nr:hypothetical protein F5050DRAFT_63571 [Lentinula boryana]